MLVHVSIVSDVKIANVIRHGLPQKATSQVNAKLTILEQHSTIMELLVVWQLNAGEPPRSLIMSLSMSSRAESCLNVCMF